MHMTQTIKPNGKVQVILRDAATGQIKHQREYTNMVVDTGKNSIASRLRGTDSVGVITYCAVGTGGTAPTEANTKLQTELLRKLISVRSVDGNDAIFETFFTTEEANGTLLEAGLFGDAATATADSGTLFCRVIINRTKTSNDTLSLVWTVTVG